MSENQKKILQMLADGKINVDEAQRLLSLTDSESGQEKSSEGKSGGTKLSARYLYVIVEPKPGVTRQGTGQDFHGKVNVRVPFGLIRAGMKLATLIPPEAADRVDEAFKEKGMPFDFRKIKDEDIEELISALHDSEVNVDSDYETVRVYAE
jgi:hypothetical protein